MDTTSFSLLRRLKQPNENRAWQRFVDLYAPLIYHWGRQQGLNGTDAADLVQDVMAILVVKLPHFEYDPSQRFRGWLRTISRNAARNRYRHESARAATPIDQVREEPDGDVDHADLFEEREYHGFLVKRALRLMQSEFSEQTWQACWRHVAGGLKAADVARDLGMTPNAVHIAKSRVMRRLREELAGLVD